MRACRLFPLGNGWIFETRLMMKANQAFVDRERLVFQPILNVADELWDTL